MNSTIIIKLNDSINLTFAFWPPPPSDGKIESFAHPASAIGMASATIPPLLH